MMKLNHELLSSTDFCRALHDPAGFWDEGIPVVQGQNPSGLIPVRIICRHLLWYEGHLIDLSDHGRDIPNDGTQRFLHPHMTYCLAGGWIDYMFTHRVNL